MRALCAVMVAAACGDPATTRESCAPDEPYPRPLEPTSVRLAAPHPLVLDGEGERCDQLMRALVDPVNRPPDLALLDAADVTGTCRYDADLQRDIVRLYPQRYGGQPLIQPGGGNTIRRQDILAHVEGTTVVYLAGTLWPAGPAPAPGCLDQPAAIAGVPGRPLGYLAYVNCQEQGTGEYTIAADDEIVAAGSGLLLDAENRLWSAHAIDVYLRADHVTPELVNSDAYCCQGDILDHCVGKRLFIDAVSGDLLWSEPHCLVC